MLEGVLHDGLQDKGGHHRLRQVEGVGDAPHHLHPVAEADVIDGVVFVHDAHLPGQRHLLVVAHEAVAQQVGQRCDEGLRAVGFFLSGGLQDHVQGVEEEVGVDLAAQLLQAAALHPVLQLQRLRLLAVKLPLHLVLLPQGSHLLGHRVLHVIERFGELGHLGLMGHRQVGRVEHAPGDLPGGTDQLLHRGQQVDDGKRHDAAQREAEGHHDGLRPLDPVAEG